MSEETSERTLYPFDCFIDRLYSGLIDMPRCWIIAKLILAPNVVEMANELSANPVYSNFI